MAAAETLPAFRIQRPVLNIEQAHKQAILMSLQDKPSFSAQNVVTILQPLLRPAAIIMNHREIQHVQEVSGHHLTEDEAVELQDQLKQRFSEPDIQQEIGETPYPPLCFGTRGATLVVGHRDAPKTGLTKDRRIAQTVINGFMGFGNEEAELNGHWLDHTPGFIVARARQRSMTHLVYELDSALSAAQSAPRLKQALLPGILRYEAVAVVPFQS